MSERKMMIEFQIAGKKRRYTMVLNADNAIEAAQIIEKALKKKIIVAKTIRKEQENEDQDEQEQHK